MLSRFLRQALRHLPPLLAALTLSGCASDEFTLEADLPGNFALAGDARYSVPAGGHCSSAAGENLTQRIFATPGRNARPYRVSYQVPLSLRNDGCKMVLSQLLLELNGGDGSQPQAAAAPQISFANLKISERRATDSSMPKRGTRIFDGRCRWLLSGQTSGNRALECHASDINGSLLEGKPGGELQRDELPGRIVRLAIGMAPDVPATVAGQ